MTLAEESFTTVFSAALQGQPCQVVGLGEQAEALPVARWALDADDSDHAMLALCVGPTLDIGCGPGRMTAALAARGHQVLGIDVVHEAVGQTLSRGVSAVRVDVFDDLPGEGSWQTALLADGNVGIGGDPVALLRRVRQLLGPHGRAVVEVAGPGVPAVSAWATLEAAGLRSRPFRWAVLGIDDLPLVARRAGFARPRLHRLPAVGGERWVAVVHPHR